MGGVVKTIANNAWQAVKAPVEAPVKAFQVLNHGGTLGQAVGVEMKTQLAPIMGVLGGVKQELMGGGDKAAMPPAPPAQTAEELQAQQEEAQRKAKADLASDRPGRSQTMLSDQSAYPYRLV